MAVEPAISAIIPTLNEATCIATLVRALVKEGFAEVIVSDGASTDGTSERAADAGAVVVRCSRGRGAQFHAGAERAKSEILFFVHADSAMPPNARAAIIAALAQAGAVAGSFSLAFDRRHWLLDALAGLSRINHSLATYGDQGLFVRRETYHAIGGYRAMPILEDLEIQHRLRRVGRFVKPPQAITTSSRRYLRNGILRRQVANAWIVARYLAGESPSRLARDYQPEPDC